MVRETYELSDFDHIQTYTADDRGRITLGKDFSERHVHVMAIDVTEELDYAERPSEHIRDALGDLASWAMEHDIAIADFDVENGRVLSQSAEWHDTPIEGVTPEW